MSTSGSRSSSSSSSSFNRNTGWLLLLLFIVVLVAILMVHNHQDNPTPPNVHGAPPPKNQTSPPPPPPPPPPPLLPTPKQTWIPDATVALDGCGNFTMISDAVAAAPSNSLRRFVIRIKPGVYNENVKVSEDKINLVLIGDGKSATVLTSDRCATQGWGTSSSATLVVMGDGFMAQDMTIENKAGPEGGQAVALLSESDESAFYRCSIVGYQDTLYAKLGRQFYRECDVYGTVDFIFGRAIALFQNCNLYARKPRPGQPITFTAQGRETADVNDGFSIHNCTITATPELESARATFRSYLGRPWKEYSTTVVMQSFLGDIIDPVGWLAWNQSYASTLDYGEYENRGPGADTSRRVRWPGYRIINSSDDARKFAVSEFIDGDRWLPAMNVPYAGGLM